MEPLDAGRLRSSEVCEALGHGVPNQHLSIHRNLVKAVTHRALLLCWEITLDLISVLDLTGNKGTRREVRYFLGIMLVLVLRSPGLPLSTAPTESL